ncbi:DNA polymerase III subunit gamma/tau [Yunchengibacter salinarum]|uniref:DNA polymerase III subunit gamma/tau n=1 Tax=Yunchengibacter salinarum TaxID=3133399 RepID=UPI0035B646EC
MTESHAEAAEYRVLARKYRPSDFATLIGQEAMVRTLSNAISAGRLAHAFVLTGVRGVGKTTTARIIAKALNCTDRAQDSVNPCGRCESCVAIGESRHVDVMEMDAASRTGIDDIRELLEGVRYAPTAARYKIYIIDEIHMLSKHAFNALLKTLEEPPSHVKFLFATTEIRKLPVTVLSRCQRFDLKRVPAETLVAHLGGIAEKEGASLTDGALKLIARAAEGSVRDALSLLDQAMAHGNGTVDEDQMRAMLGLADRAQVLDLFETVMKGDAAGALAQLRQQFDLGAEPVVILNDLLEVTHWITRTKAAPEVSDDALATETERSMGKDMAARLSIPQLARAWQVLLKGVGEARTAPSPMAAAEMVMIRLCHLAPMEPPADLVKKLQAGAPAGGPSAPGGGAGSQAGGQAQAGGGRAPATGGGGGATATARVLAFDPDTQAQSQPGDPVPADFEALVALFEHKREAQLAYYLSHNVTVARYEPGRLDFTPTTDVPPTLAGRVRDCLNAWTDRRWAVSVVRGGGGETLQDKRDARQEALRAEVMRDPMVKAFMETFPGARLAGPVRDTTLEEAAEPVPFDPDAEEAVDAEADLPQLLDI